MDSLSVRVRKGEVRKELRGEMIRQMWGNKEWGHMVSTLNLNYRKEPSSRKQGQWLGGELVNCACQALGVYLGLEALSHCPSKSLITIVHSSSTVVLFCFRF